MRAAKRYSVVPVTPAEAMALGALYPGTWCQAPAEVAPTLNALFQARPDLVWCATKHTVSGPVAVFLLTETGERILSERGDG